MTKENLTLSSIYWTEKPISKNEEKKIICNFYNTNKLMIFPFTKPISKIINLENAPMENQ
ncbi:MAG: hypothetical protein ACOYMA_07530 [Bacteroidia bacterium]